MKVVKILRTILDTISEKMSIGILAVMVVLVVSQVIARYCFHSPIPWTEQLSKYMFVWLVLISGAYMFGQRGHMNISFFKGKLPKTIQTVLDYMSEIILLVFAGAVLLVGGFMALKIGIPQRDAALQISMGYVYSALPISGVITLLYSVCNLVELSKKEC